MFKKKSPYENKKKILVRKDDEIKVVHNIQKTPPKTYIEGVKFKQQKASIENRTIAFCSTHQGAGCTHIALMVAFELSQRYKTAIVELDSEDCLRRFDEIYKLKKGRAESRQLEQLDVYFYNDKTLLEIYKQGYEFIVFDVGTIVSKVLEDDKTMKERAEKTEEAYKANKRVIVTQVKEWQQNHLAKFLEQENVEDWTLITNLTNQKDYKELSKLLKMEIINMPYIDDPFRNHAIEEEILRKIIE